MAMTLIKGYEGELDPAQFKDLYQERIHRIIDAEVNRRIKEKLAPASPTTGVPDLTDQIRLSLAQLEKKRDAKKPVRKTTTLPKKKPQRIRA